MLVKGEYEEFGEIAPFNKDKVLKYNIWAFDTENEKDGRVTIVNFYNGKDHFTFYPQKQGFRVIHNWIYKKLDKRNVLFVAHNLEYDIVNLFRESKFKLINEMLYAGTRLITCNLKEHKAKFLDSFNFFAGSLKKMGEVVGIEKGDFEEARLSEKENTLYCRSDCEILWEFMNRFQNKVNNEDGLTLPATIGRISLDSFRKNYLKEPLVTYNSIECLKAYAGGRVECFHVGSVEGDIEFADVKSMYPTQMTGAFPDCGTLEEGVSPLDTEFGISECTIHVPASKFYIGPLWVKHKGKLTFPVGTLRGFWTFHEIRTALEYGASLKAIHWSIGTNIAINDLFKDFILDNYKRRQKSDSAFDNTYYKLKMNNGYGKLVQHNDSTLLSVGVIDSEKCEKQNLKLKDSIGPFYKYSREIKEPPKFACFLWGAHITAYARDYLYRGLMAIYEAGHTPLYCDTDSIAYIRNNKSNPLKLGSELGEWELDKYVKAQIFTLKGYIFEDKNGKQKIASKGVKNHLALDFFSGEEVTIEKPMKLKEALKRGILPNLWTEHKKQKVSEYDKRIIKENGKTLPINIDFLNEISIIKEDPQKAEN